MRWKKKLKRVRPRIDAVDLQRLTAANISDMETLEERFYGNLDSSLRKAGQTLNVSQDVIAGLVAKSLVSSSEPLTKSWIGKYWADLVVVVAFLYIAVALARPWLVRPVPPGPQVVAAAGIPIYGMIRDGDLRVMNAGARRRSRYTSESVGRYALVAIAAGAAITKDKLSAKKTDLTDFAVLQLEIKHAPPLDGRTLPEAVDLLFSSRQDATASAPLPALLLAFDTTANPPLATVAVPKDQTGETSKWIGSCDVYLSVRVR
jgi:hypothetical protein